MAGLFFLLRGTKDGFKAAEALEGTDGEPLIITGDEVQRTDAICTRPTAVDWDQDGDLDLIVGNFAGTFYVFTGEGKGRFHPKPTAVMVGGKRLELSGRHSDPFCVDWDGDGDLDLLTGAAAGGVYLSRNEAGAGKTPELSPFEELIAPARRSGSADFVSEDDLKGPGPDTRVWVDDVNGDGALDLLVGDNVTLRAPAEGLTEAEASQRMEGWSKERRRLQDAMGTADDQDSRDAASRAYSDHYRSRRAFMNEQSTGYVWLFLQR